MKSLDEIRKYEIEHPVFKIRGEGCDGFFMIPYRNYYLAVQSSSGGGWEHVSVSHKTRNPNWDEMNFIKDLFFGDEETVVQFHPRKSEYVNLCERCLHLWKKIGSEFELPPKNFVGF